MKSSYYYDIVVVLPRTAQKCSSRKLKAEHHATARVKQPLIKGTWSSAKPRAARKASAQEVASAAWHLRRTLAYMFRGTSASQTRDSAPPPLLVSIRKTNWSRIGKHLDIFFFPFKQHKNTPNGATCKSWLATPNECHCLCFSRAYFRAAIRRNI